MKVCPACDCQCWIMDEECIIQRTNINDIGIIKDNHIGDTNDNLDDLLGLKCAEELCAATAKAVEELNAAGDETKTVLDFLEDKWKAVITNKHFKNWYAKRVEYNWLEGSSITELKDVGLIKATNDDDNYKNAFKHAPEKDRQRLAVGALDKAEKSKRKFQITYWFCNIGLYDCLSDCCKMPYYSEYQSMYGSVNGDGTIDVYQDKNYGDPYGGLNGSIGAEII